MLARSSPPAAAARRFGGARIAAIAIAAALSAAACHSALSDGASDGGGAALDASIAMPVLTQAPWDMDGAARPWAEPLLAPAYAAGHGDAYIITDLGNTFKLDIEQPPGINWTQVLLDRIRDAEERSRESVDDLRTETRTEAREAEARVRDIINNYIQNNTILLEERAKQFEQFATVTNMTISDMISRDMTLNASINELVQNIRHGSHSSTYLTMLSREAAVSAISSQVHYVSYDNPAIIMTCSGTACQRSNVGPIMDLEPGAAGYTVYDDPSWQLPSVYPVSPIHYGARYIDDNTLAVTTIPADYIRLYSERVLGVDHTAWGCYSSQFQYYCNSGLMPVPTLADHIIDTQAGYPYHVSMVVRETAPHVAPGQSISSAKYGTATSPFGHGDIQSKLGRLETKYDTSEMIGFGIGGRGALTKYFSTAASAPPMPVSGTTQTWPNCASLPVCDALAFAFGNFIPSASPLNSAMVEAYNELILPARLLACGGNFLCISSRENVPIADSWEVFISPQVHVTTWGPRNSLKGDYSPSPQFVDRLNREIVAPTPSEPAPASEAGRIYDVRSYIRIPFATETPMNVSHVSLRPLSVSPDMEKVGRDYVADRANSAQNIYNIRGHELQKLGLVNCEPDAPAPTCDERRTGEGRSSAATWASCRLLGGGDAACSTTLADIGRIVSARMDFDPEFNVRLEYLEGVYSDALHVPLIHGYSGFRMVVDGVAVFTKYSDVRSDSTVFLSPPREAHVGKVSQSPIHAAGANVTTTAHVVAPRDGDMNILAVVSATGTIDITNEYYVNVRPPRPPVVDPLSVTMEITRNGAHYKTLGVGINEHPATAVNNTLVEIPLERGGMDHVATRSVSYDYPSFVFAGTANVPVSAGDHILFELTAKIDGEIDEWSPAGTVQKTRGTSSAEIAINAASIMMGVG